MFKGNYLCYIKKAGTQLTVAINHENLYYHTALQAVHLTWNKGKDSFI